MPDDLVLVCSRTLGRNRPDVPGSTRRQCHRCQAEVFVSPSSAAIVKRHGVDARVRILCVECAMLESPPDKWKWAPLTPAQVGEILADAKRRRQAPL